MKLLRSRVSGTSTLGVLGVSSDGSEVVVGGVCFPRRQRLLEAECVLKVAAAGGVALRYVDAEGTELGLPTGLSKETAGAHAILKVSKEDDAADGTLLFEVVC